MPNCIVSTASTDGLAPLGARPSAGTVMTIHEFCIWVLYLKIYDNYLYFLQDTQILITNFVITLLFPLYYKTNPSFIFLIT